MNLSNLFEGAIDDLEQRRIEDLESKMDDLAARAKESKDPKHIAALRHEFAKCKAERDSYYHVREWEDTAPGHDETQTELRPVEEASSPAQQAAIAIAKKKEQKVDEHGGGGAGPREWHNYVKAHRTDEELDTNYTYTVYIDGNPIGTYGSKEEAKAIVRKKKEVAPGRDYRIKPKSRTSAASIRRFNKNRDRMDEADREVETTIRTLMAPAYEEETGGQFSYTLEKKAPTMAALREKFHDDLNAILTQASPKELAQAAQELKAMYGKVNEGWSDAIVSRRTGQPRTPYSVYINGKKWKDFENDDHAEAVANKLRAKFKEEGRDPSVITIAPTDYNKGMDEAYSKTPPNLELLKDLATQWQDGSDTAYDAISQLGWNIADDRKGVYIIKQSDMSGRSKIYFPELTAEGSMASAEHHHTGPEFTGYWKGTDSATPGNKMVGGAAESTENPLGHKELEYLMAKAKQSHNQPDPELHAGDEHEINGDQDQVDEMGYRDPGGFVNWARKQGQRFAGFLHDPEVWNAAQAAYDQEMAVAEAAPQAATPRNFVVKNMKQSGQGKHKDQKRAQKQGDVKHKGQRIPMDMEEGAKVDRMQKHIAKSEKDLGHSKKDAEAIAWATLNKRGYLDNANKKKHNESVNFMEWAVAQGSRFANFAGNPEVYAEARAAYLAEGFGTSLANVSSKISGHPRKIKSAQQIRNKAMKFAPQPVAEDELNEFDAALQAMGGIGGLLKEYGVPLMAFAAVAAAYGISKAAKALEQSESTFAKLVHKAIKAVDKASIHNMASKLHDMALAEDQLNEIKKGQKDSNGYTSCWPGYHAQGTKKSATTGKQVRNCVPNESVEEDWQKANKKDKTDGMSRKAVKAYRREHPGSKLQTAVTTKPSKLKKGSKASKRRSSYCSRSKGQMKMHNISCKKTPDKAICKARRRWNCESQEQFDAMLREAVEKGTLQPGQYYIWTVYFDDGSNKKIKVTKDNFDPKAYYAKQNKVVINVEYDWTVHGE